ASAGILPPREANGGVPAGLSDLIVQLLAPDPARRPSSAHDVAARLTDIGASLPHLERALSDAPQPSLAAPPDRRRRNVLAAAGGAIVLLLAAVIIRVLTDRGEFIIESSDPDVEIVLRQAGGMLVRDRRTNRTYEL